MKRFILPILLLAALACGIIYAGEDAGLAGAAYKKANAALPASGGTVSGNISMADGAQVELATGTLANLSLRLRTNPTTGWYSPSSGVWSSVCNGVEAQRWTATGTLIATSASNIVDFGPTGDVDTGIKFPSLNVIELYSAGAQAMRIFRENILLGPSISPNLAGTFNVGIGYGALYNAGNLSGMTAIGANTMGGVMTAGNNTAIGICAGSKFGSGEGNVAIGAYAGYPASHSNSTLYSVCIGYNVFNTASNQVVLGAASANDFQVGQGGVITRITTGASATFAAASGSYALPIIGPAKTWTLASGSVSIVKAIVTAQTTASAEVMIWELRSAISANNNAPFTMGASSTVFDSWGDNSLYGCHIVAGAPGFSIVASGPINSVWKVKRLETQ